jgi:protein O-GlcNAc transferase
MLDSFRQLLRGKQAAPEAGTLRKRGNALLSEGKPEQAAELYRQAIEITPNDPGVLVSHGFALVELRRFNEARPLLERAVSLDPSQEDAYFLLAMVERQSSNSNKAIAHLRAALALRADFTACRLDLSRLLFERGDPEGARRVADDGLTVEPHSVDLRICLAGLQLIAGDDKAAAASLEAAIRLSPQHADARRQLGGIRQSQGDLEAALQAYRAISVQGSEDGPRWLSLGVAFHDGNSLEKAKQCYEAAIAVRPDLAEAHACLGAVLRTEGALAEALARFEEAIRLQPTYAAAHNGLALTLQASGKVLTAVNSYRTAISLVPRFAEAHRNLGTAMQEQGKFEQAMACYAQARALDPGDPAVHNNMGALLRIQGALSQARDSYRTAIAGAPNSALAHKGLGTTLQEMGEHEEACAALRSALELDPRYTDAHHDLLFALNYHPDKSAHEIFRSYQDFNNRFGRQKSSARFHHTINVSPDRLLRIGYVSPDFREHSVRHFLEPLLAQHDRQQFEVFAYAELSQEDAVTARYRSYVDHWIRTDGLTDDALARRIRADEIDILVDLAGHTAKNRLLTFAGKPTPVSLSWLGFGYTTGLSAIDYLLTDEACAPAGSDDLFSERPWRLPTPGFVYRPAERMGEVNILPASTSGHVTFGTLTRAVRVNHRTIRVWANVLRRVPGSRLVVDSSSYRDPGLRASLLDRFSAHGIEPDRLQIGFHSPPWDVLRGIDIALDCFPHNSGTTLFESLYMGVPYVTLAGRPSVGRLGSSILIGLGRPEWIATSEEEYADKCVSLASDVPALAALRAGLRSEMRASALMDETGFARKVESAYREMFERWAATKQCSSR